MSMDDDRAWLAAHNIKIAQRPKDSEFADEFLRTRPPLDNLVEIGVNHGGSLFVLGNYVRKGGLIVGIDPFEPRPHGRDRGPEHVVAAVAELCKRGYDVRLLKQKSCDALPQVREMFADKGIDYLHIDGSHFYEDVKADFEGYGPLVRPGGVIQMHDIHNTKFGVARFWRETVGPFASVRSARHVGIVVMPS